MTIMIQPFDPKQWNVHPLEKRIFEMFFEPTANDGMTRYTAANTADNDAVYLNKEDQADLQILSAGYEEGWFLDWVFADFDEDNLRWEEFPIQDLLKNILTRTPSRKYIWYYDLNEESDDFMYARTICIICREGIRWRTVADLATYYSDGNIGDKPDHAHPGPYNQTAIDTVLKARADAARSNSV